MFSNRSPKTPSPDKLKPKRRPDPASAYASVSLGDTRGPSASPSPPGKVPVASPSKRREVRPVDGTSVPEPTAGETERLLPTVTVMRHSTTLKRTGKHDPNFTSRAHDPGITNHEAPQEATQLLMVDLRISSRNNKKHRILVMSSPMQNCLQTAVIVAQELGVREIQVHDHLVEAVSALRDMGWDFNYETLALRRSEMDRVVRLASQEGEEMRNKAPVTISAVLGRAIGRDELQESDAKYRHRVGEVLEEAVSSLEFDGDHIVIIGHTSTLSVLSQHFSEKVDVVSADDCGFLTLCTPSSRSCWFSGRSRVQLRPLRSLDLTKKIGSQ